MSKKVTPEEREKTLARIRARAEERRKIKKLTSGGQWRRDHPEESKQYNKEYYRNSLKKPKSIRDKFCTSVRVAENRALAWELEFAQYEKLMSSPCHYCGKDLIMERGISLDRIDNSLGYIEENVLPCCGQCNNIRGRYLTVEEAEIAVKAVLEYRKSKVLSC